MQSVSFNPIQFSVVNDIPTLTLPTPFHKANQEELLLLERHSNASALFQDVFDIPDHTRWTVMYPDKITVQFIPGKVNKYAPNHNDMVRKVASMLYMLKNQYLEELCLDEETKTEIEAKATYFLTNSSSTEMPLQNYTWTRIRESLLLLGYPSVEEIDDCIEKSAPSAVCKVFCNPDIVAKQLIATQLFHNVLTNSLPYVNEHVMIVTKECHRTSNARTDEEIKEKYQLIQRVALIFEDRFQCLAVGVITREGAMAGQTQPHLHDHVIGFNPNQEGDQLWMSHWRNELSNQTIDKSPAEAAVAKIKKIMPRLFSPIKAIVFDIGGVVVEQHCKEVEWLNTLTSMPYGEFLEPLTEGKINEDIFWTQMGQRHGFTYDETFRKKWKEIYLESNPVCEKVIKAIQNLREQGFTLFVLSNTFSSHYRINVERRLFDLFHGVVNSHEVGMSKPGQGIYIEVCQRTRFQPEEHLFIDDRVENVLAAHQAGMHAYVWKNEDQGLERLQAYLASQ